MVGRICDLSDKIRVDPFGGLWCLPTGRTIRGSRGLCGSPRSPSVQPPAALPAVIGFMTQKPRGHGSPPGLCVGKASKAGFAVLCNTRCFIRKHHDMLSEHSSEFFELIV